MRHLLYLLALLVPVYSMSQVAVNRNWVVSGGEPDSVAWSASKIDPFGSVLTVGNEENANGDADIYIEKVDPFGTIEWTYSYDYSGGEDYGVALVLDNAGDVYVAGAGWNNAQQNYDFVMLKITSNGTLVWSTFYNGIDDLNDIPADLVLMSPTNKLFACGGSEGTSSMTDMLTLCLDVNSGGQYWDKRYNYANLHDGAVGVQVNQFNEIVVVGASADSNGLYDNASIKYDEFGNAIQTTRTSQGVGIDEPRAIDKDAFGNWYVAGHYQALPQNSSIVVYKLDTNLNVVWSHVADPTTGIDRASDLILDPTGITYVTGYITEASGQTLSYTCAIDPSGSVQWNRTYKLPGKSIKGLKLTLDTAGGIQVLGEVDDGSQTDLMLLRYLPGGELFFARTIHLEGDQRATEVLADYSNHIYLTGQTVGDTVDDFITLQYEWSENQMPAVLDTNGNPFCVSDELLIRFNPNQMKLDFVDNLDKEYGLLKDAVQQPVIDSMNQFVDFDFGRQSVYKVFRSITSQNTQSLTQQGHVVRQPTLWTTLNVQIPEGVNLDTLQDSLESLYPLIYYTDRNFFGVYHSNVPNDPYYDTAANYHPTVTYPRPHINIEPAWALTTGDPSIKAGIFDSGLEWDHEDFQFHGNTIIQDVWDFEGNNSWIQNTNADLAGHGTWVAGILGAVRNNGVGNAGIAGGHDSTVVSAAKRGVSMYGLRIESGGQFGGWYAPVLSYWADAMYTSTLSDTGNYHYGLHIQNYSTTMAHNHSLANDTNISILRDATRAVFRNGVTMVGARGNDSYDYHKYPVTYDDKWFISVGGIGTNGNYQNGNPANCEVNWTSIGKSLDVAAPASHCVSQLVPKSPPGGANNYYEGFGGSSGAAPHVTGTGVLLMSYLNDTANGFFLHPEDIEWVVQLSATDTYTLGVYDDYTGYGRLNAGAALQLVEKPNKRIEHHGSISTNASLSRSLHATGDTIELTEGYESHSNLYVNAGNYIADVYEITATVNHSFDTTDTMIASWIRNDQTTVMPLFNSQNKLVPREEAFWAQPITETQAILKGYVYLLKEWPGGTNVIGWIPRDTNLNDAILEYSLLIHPKSAYPDTADSTMDSTVIVPALQSELDNILLHPNPSGTNHMIEIPNTDNLPITIDLVDIMGRQVEHKEYHPNGSGYLKITRDLTHITPGAYFYIIGVGDVRTTIRFVKIQDN